MICMENQPNANKSQFNMVNVNIKTARVSIDNVGSQEDYSQISRRSFGIVNGLMKFSLKIETENCKKTTITTHKRNDN